MVPKALGGTEADPITQVEIFEEVARADGSAGWCLMIGAGLTGLAGAYLADEAVQTIFKTPHVLVAGHLVPRGQATKERGGYRVSGQWSFASGCRHATWILGNCLVQRNHEPAGQHSILPEMRVMCIPKDQVQIHDNWYVAGLKGTASCDYSITDLFVTEGFSFDLLNVRPRRGGPLYRLPFFTLAAPGHAGYALGVGRRALDEIVRIAETKLRFASSTSLAGRGAFQQALARAEASLRSARLFLIDTLGEVWRTVYAGDDITFKQRALVRLAVTHATDVAADVVTQAYRYGGGGALFQSSVLQRCLRDMYAATQHVYVGDETYEMVARALLGVEQPHPFL
jgi:alkylation response protein AidB-like acyl-CoA dehydrogenase